MGTGQILREQSKVLEVLRETKYSCIAATNEGKVCSILCKSLVKINIAQNLSERTCNSQFSCVPWNKMNITKPRVCF